MFVVSTPTPKGEHAAHQQEIAGSAASDVRVWLYWRWPGRWRAQVCQGPLGPAGRGRRASGIVCWEEGRLGMSPLLEVQRPCAGIGSGDTPDFAQLIICGTVIPPPSSQEVPVHAAGWMGLPELTTHGRGLELRSQLFRPQGWSVRVQVLISRWLLPPARPQGRDSEVGGLVEVSARGSTFPVRCGGFCSPERGSAAGRECPVLHVPGWGCQRLVSPCAVGVCSPEGLRCGERVPVLHLPGRGCQRLVSLCAVGGSVLLRGALLRGESARPPLPDLRGAPLRGETVPSSASLVGGLGGVFAVTAKAFPVPDA